MAKYSIPDTTIFQELGGEVVLLNLKNERYYSLDEVGATFWQLLSSGQNLDDIVKAMLDEFDIDETQLRRDLEALIGEMEKAEIIQVEP